MAEAAGAADCAAIDPDAGAIIVATGTAGRAGGTGAAELSTGGTSESPDVDDPVGAGTVVAPEELADGAIGVPGGGAATASGSSISSSGKSGNCSSNAETGTSANRLGTAGLPCGATADAGAEVEVPKANGAELVAPKPAALELATVDGVAAPAVEPPSAATPTGFVLFLTPAAAALADGALRAAALAVDDTLEGLAPLTGTPTALEAPGEGVTGCETPARGAADAEGSSFEGAISVGASGSTPNNAPCDSKSSSESITPFGGGDAVDAGAVPAANPGDSSTGRSAKGSKAGREAASIVFEPEQGERS